MRTERKIQRRLSLIFAVIMMVLSPMQAFAQGYMGINVRLSSGVNDYEMINQEAISEEDMDALLSALSNEYITDISGDEKAFALAAAEAESQDTFEDMPVAEAAVTEEDAVIEETLEAPFLFSLFAANDPDVTGDDEMTAIPEGTFRLYPVTDKENGGYIFKGVIAGGDTTADARFTGLKFSLNGGSEETAATVSEAIYPDSSTLSSARYTGGGDNWQRVYRVSEFEEDKIYTFSYEYEYCTDPGSSDGDDGDTETATGSESGQEESEKIYNHICESSDQFLIYRLKDGDTLLKVSRWYGTGIDTLKEDNGIADADNLLKSGDTLFIRNPKTDIALTKSGVAGDLRLMERIGDNPAAQYEYSAVDAGTGNLYFSQTEIHLDEYSGFDITRTYNSMTGNEGGLFGYGFSTEADMRIAATGAGMLFWPDDGSMYLLSPCGEEKWSGRSGWYTLEKTDAGFVLTDPQLEKWTFDSYGQIRSFENKSHCAVMYSYTGDHKLEKIISSSGTEFGIALNEDGNITCIQKPDGSEIKYSYDRGYLTGIINENGYRTDIVYNADGLISRIINQLGNDIFSAVYDEKGRVVSYADAEGNSADFVYSQDKVIFTDRNGSVTEYGIDTGMHPVRATYADGSTTEAEFDSCDRLIRYKDRSGAVTVYEYDTKGNLLKVTYKGKPTEENQYDARNNLVSSADEAGRVTRYEYDANDNNTKVIYPDGSKCCFAYDSRNRLTSITDQTNNTTAYEYEDKYYEFIAKTDALGSRTEYAYDGMRRLVRCSEAAGTSDESITEYEYSPAGEQISTKKPDGSIETYSYDKAGNNIGTTRPDGSTILMQYDKNGRMIRVVTSGNDLTDITYDGNGNVTSQADASGAVTTYDYDQFGNLKKESAPDGSSVSYEYDGKGRVIKETDADGATKTYEYHQRFDVVIREKDKLDRITEYSYDDAGNLTETILPDGNRLVNTYDAMNRPKTSKDIHGVLTENTYDSAGRVIETKDSTGSRTTFEYDTNGNLIRETDALGQSISHEYDSKNQLISTTDAEGNKTTYTYDKNGRKLSQTDGTGAVRSYEYDSNGNMTSVTDGNGNKTVYTYDSSSRVIKETYADGTSCGKVYDGSGNLVKTVDQYGNICEMTYDSKKRKTKSKDAYGNETEYAYDNDGNVILTKEANGAKTKNTYNKLGWLIRTEAPSGLKTENTYDLMGHLIKSENSLGQSDTYAYDSAGNLTVYTDPMGCKTEFFYDEYDRIIRKELPDGSKERYEYDVLSRIIAVTDKRGRRTSYEYNSKDKITKTTDWKGRESKNVFDAGGQVISLTNKVGYVSTLAYDANGNTIKTTDPQARVNKAEYDSMNRMVCMTDPTGGKTEYEYNASGQKIKVITPAGTETSFEYDKLGRNTASKTAYGVSTKAYDAVGKVISSKDENGNETRYEYDVSGNLIKETKADGTVTEYEYDALGQLKTERLPGGRKKTYEYDKLGRKTAETSVTGVATEYRYDTYGNLTELSDSTGKKVEYTYDNYNRKIRETTLKGGWTIYAYDNEDRLVRKEDDHGAVTEYTYDDLDRVTGITYPTGLKSTYTYDKVGNIIKTSKGGRETGYEYDANGNLLSSVFADGSSISTAYDGDGNIIEEKSASGAVTRYAYDKGGRLTEVSDALGRKAAMTYDAAGNVTSETMPDGSTVTYEYDVMNRLGRLKEADGREGLYEYDYDGNLKILVTKYRGILADGKTFRRTLFTYTDDDNLASVVSTLDESKQLTEGEGENFGYSLSGKLKEDRLESGKIIEYAYDEHDNLTNISYRNDPQESIPVSFRYDSRGQVTAMSDGSGETEYEYDACGRLVSQTNGMGQRIGYEYDEWSELIKLTYPDGRTVSYEYDNMGRAVSEEDSINGRTEYAYDKSGNQTLKKLPDGSRTETEYDIIGRVVSRKSLAADGMLISGYEYTYDSMDRITQERVTDSTGTAFRCYSYDICGQLIKEEERASDGKMSLIEYTYDAIGNRISKTDTEDGRDSRTTRYEYDNNDRLIKETSDGRSSICYTYDADGNLVEKRYSSITEKYTYSGAGKLIRTERNGQLVEENKYDGLGNKYYSRLMKTAQSAGSSNLVNSEKTFTRTEESTFVPGSYIAMESVREALSSELMSEGIPVNEEGREVRDSIKSKVQSSPGGTRVYYEEEYYLSAPSIGTGKILSVSDAAGKVLKSYVYSADGERESATDGRGTGYYYYDGRGSVSEEIKGGNTEQRLRYDGYGNITTCIDEQERIYGYNGEEYTPQTGLVYLNARNYDPQTGRFTSRDRYLGSRMDLLSQNRYIYCINDPVNRCDPSGYKPKPNNNTITHGALAGNTGSSGSTCSAAAFPWMSSTGTSGTVTVSSGYTSSSGSKPSGGNSNNGSNGPGGAGTGTYSPGPGGSGGGSGSGGSGSSGGSSGSRSSGGGSGYTVTNSAAFPWVGVNWNLKTKGKIAVKNNYTSASGNSSGSGSTTQNGTATSPTQGGTTTSGGKNTTTSSPTLSRYNATRDYIYVSGAAMKWEAKLADGTVRVKAKRSSVPSGNKKAIESYWNSERNFQGTWWTHEGTLLDSYDTLIQEARDNGGSLDMNEVMMNPNKMIVLQAMMMVFPKSGYYDEAMEAKLNLIGVQSGWHYDAGTGKLSLGMLNDISEYYDSIDDAIKALGVLYDNGGAEMFAGAMTWGMGITATVAANAAGKNSNSNTDRGGSTQNEEGASSEGSTNSATQKTYQTYTKTNPVTGEVYSGRTSGYGTSAENVRNRDLNHHMNEKGFGPAQLDKTSTDYNAIRGREQMLIESNGGAKSVGGTSGNAINEIGPNNKKMNIYINAAKELFGEIR